MRERTIAVAEIPEEPVVSYVHFEDSGNVDLQSFINQLDESLRLAIVLFIMTIYPLSRLQMCSTSPRERSGHDFIAHGDCCPNRYILCGRRVLLMNNNNLEKQIRELGKLIYRSFLLYYDHGRIRFMHRWPPLSRILWKRKRKSGFIQKSQLL